jgi:hypothetical protein
MGKRTRISKMFGPLVLGGGMLVQSMDAEANPVEQEPTEEPPIDESRKATDEQKGGAKAPSTVEAEEPQTGEPVAVESSEDEASGTCQLEFTLHEYDRDGVASSKTCLDGKSNAEILEIVEEAKNQTCASPFCGCWLG